MNRQRTTRKLETSAPRFPVKDQDDYSPQDHNRDGTYHDAKIGDAIKEIFRDIPCIVSGGIVTSGGSTLNITALTAISLNNEEIQDTIFENDIARIFEFDALTGWMDAGADDTGATNYIKCRYKADDHSDLRDKLYASGSYNYKQIDSYEISANITAPVAGEVCLGEFTKVSGTITSLTFVYRTNDAILNLASLKVFKNSIEVAQRPGLNLVEGSNVTLTVSDNPTEERVDARIDVDLGEIQEFQDVYNRLRAQERLNLEQELRLSYIDKQQFQALGRILELFFNDDQIQDIETDSNKTMSILDDLDWNNSWKMRESEPAMKEGLARLDKLPYLLETIDEFALENIGQNFKCALSRDVTNECIWIMTNAGANAIGTIVRAKKRMDNSIISVDSVFHLPAGGASNAWTGIESDGTNVYFVLYGGAGLTASKVYGIKINSNGSLGETGYEVYNGETVDLVNSCYASHTIANAGADTGYYNDVISWDSNDIMVLVCNGNTNVNLVSLDKTNLGIGTAPNQIGFEKYVGGTLSTHRTITYNGTDIFIRMNDLTDNNRFIYKFITSDIVSNICINSSGRFDNTRYYRDEESYGFGGISFDLFGDIIESVSTASHGKLIARRALKNAIWAENHINKQIRLTDAGTNDNRAICVDPNGTYVWYSANNGVDNAVRIYRRNIATGSESFLTINAGGWDSVFDLCIADVTGTDYFFLIGYDGINYIARSIDRSTIETALGGNLDISTAGNVFTGYESAKVQYAICTDTTYLYIVCDTDDAIDRWNLLATPTKADDNFITIWAATTSWNGIAHNNNKFYITDYNSGGSGMARIYAIDDAPISGLSSTLTGRKLHAYQDPSTSIGTMSLTVNDNDLWTVDYNDMVIRSLKILDDPDVMQLHNFLDANNILMTDDIRTSSGIVSRFNTPEGFTDKLSIPDQDYLLLGYGNEGFSVLQLTEFLSGRSSSGLERFDITKIVPNHFKRGANNVIDNAAAIATCSFICDDILLMGTPAHGLFMFDFKSGDYYKFNTTGMYKGLGTYSTRNDGLGYSTTFSAQCKVSNNAMRRVYARTFRKEDISDFNEDNPKTFVIIGTDAGQGDLLVIDWDGKRAPIRVYRTIMSGFTSAISAWWISPSGYVFAHNSTVAGSKYIAKSREFVWACNEDSKWVWDSSYVDRYLTDLIAYEISHHSQCFRNAKGDWRHILGLSGSDLEISALIDFENRHTATVGQSAIAKWVADPDMIAWSCDNYDDLFFFIPSFLGSAPTGLRGLEICKRYRFNDFSSFNLYFDPTAVNYQLNGWSIVEANENSRPLWVPKGGLNHPTSIKTDIRYNKDHGICILTNGDSGMQLFHIGYQLDECLLKSIPIDIDNPEEYHFLKTIVNSDAFDTEPIDKDDSDITYTDGNIKTWTIGAEINSIDEDGVTEGYLEWDIAVGNDYAGVQFRLGTDCGRCKITLTEDPSGTPINIIDGLVIDLYASANIDPKDYIFWCSLNPMKDYTLKVEHNGDHNASASSPYSLKVYQYLLTVKMIDADFEAKLLLTDSDFGGYEEIIDLNSNGLIRKIVSFAANGTQDTFVLTSSDDRAARPTRFGKMPSGGTYPQDVTWYDESDISILNWGNNSPDYNNNEIDASAHYGSKWLSPPAAGTVYFEFVPSADQMVVSFTGKLPYNGTKIKRTGDYSLLDYVCEVI